MHTRFLIAVMQLVLLYRRCAWHAGFRLRILGKLLMRFGEEDVRHSWGVVLFAHLPLSQIEIVGSFPKIYRGALLGASFHLNKQSAKKYVVFHLNWIAARDTTVPLVEDVWDFAGPCDIVVDPKHSPLHELPDGTLWFMWPQGGYGMMYLHSENYLPFTGDPETPRIYTYF